MIIIALEWHISLDAWAHACRAYRPRMPTHRSRYILPNYRRNHPECMFWCWQIASGTVFVVSAMRPRREWFPSIELCLYEPETVPSAVPLMHVAHGRSRSDVPVPKKLKTKSLGDTPNYSRNHPKCIFSGWQIASGTLFAIAATRPRHERLASNYVFTSPHVHSAVPPRTLRMEGQDQPCLFQRNWKPSLWGIRQITPRTTLNAFFAAGKLHLA